MSNPSKSHNVDGKKDVKFDGIVMFIKCYMLHASNMKIWIVFLTLDANIILAKCHNLPFSRRVRQDSKECHPKRTTRGSCHQCLFEENIRKTKKRSANFENKGSRVVYAWGRY